MIQIFKTYGMVGLPKPPKITVETNDPGATVKSSTLKLRIPYVFLIFCFQFLFIGRHLCYEWRFISYDSGGTREKIDLHIWMCFSLFPNLTILFCILGADICCVIMFVNTC